MVNPTANKNPTRCCSISVRYVSGQARITASVIALTVGFVGLIIGALLAYAISEPVSRLSYLAGSFDLLSRVKKSMSECQRHPGNMCWRRLVREMSEENLCMSGSLF